MRTNYLLVILASFMATVIHAQGMTSAASAPTSAPIPKFLVYRHFLGWVIDLNSKAVAAGDSNPYKFAEPFQRAGLQNDDLDTVLKEAKALESDLAAHKQRLASAVAAYRKSVSTSGDQGALPPLPQEIHQLEAMRTAILIQQMHNLQSALGPQKSVQLDAYLMRVFAPHISLRPLVRPPAMTSPTNPVPAFPATGK